MLLDDVKLYLRVDSTDEDNVIRMLVSSAQLFIKTATGVEFDEKDSRHMTVLCQLVGHWYDNRGLVGTAAELPFTVTAQLIQIEAERRY